ncbi:MAG: SCO family protein [Magnetococcales bacterium]|nr:SCO family protein [Magnetococcales bacterium]
MRSDVFAWSAGIRGFLALSLLGCLLPALLWAQAPVGKGRDPVFDPQLALEASQAAIGRTLENYTLINAAGESVELSGFLGKPLVISMIYTSCYHTCSLSTRFLASVLDKARDIFGSQSFHVVTIGFDTRFDTPKAMATFARQQGVENQPNWTLLSGSPETITRLSHQLGFLFAPSPKGFDHLVQATVVDAKGVIYRQVYGESFQTQLLTEPLRSLILGTPPTDNETPVEELVRRVRFFCTTYDPTTDAYRFDYSLFIGMFCGGSVILITIFLLLREWWQNRRRPRA